MRSSSSLCRPVQNKKELRKFETFHGLFSVISKDARNAKIEVGQKYVYGVYGTSEVEWRLLSATIKNFENVKP